MLKTDKRVQELTYRRYFGETKQSGIKDIIEDLGISKGTYYNIHKEMLEDLGNYLELQGYGYDYASNVYRDSLPKRLSKGVYENVGGMFIYEDPEDGEYYDIVIVFDGIGLYKCIVVEEYSELGKYEVEGSIEVNVGIEGVEKVYDLGKEDVGLLVVIDESKYRDGEDISYVLHKIEIDMVDIYGYEETIELLGKRTIMMYRNIVNGTTGSVKEGQ